LIGHFKGRVSHEVIVPAWSFVSLLVISHQRNKNAKVDLRIANEGWPDLRILIVTLWSFWGDFSTRKIVWQNKGLTSQWRFFTSLAGNKFEHSLSEPRIFRTKFIRTKSLPGPSVIKCQCQPTYLSSTCLGTFYCQKGAFFLLATKKPRDRKNKNKKKSENINFVSKLGGESCFAQKIYFDTETKNNELSA
jgi:hypothetical protein